MRQQVVRPERRDLVPERLQRRCHGCEPASWSSSSKMLTAACTPVASLVDHAEQLADAADEQPLLVDLDPHARRRAEHHVTPTFIGIDTPAEPHQ